MNISVQEFLKANHLLSVNPLFVFAMEIEAAQEFDDLPAVVVGIGKVNAAFHLAKKIMETRPGLIINLGSAGSKLFQRGEVVCCTRFVQRDMDVTALGFRKYETPLSGQEPVLRYGLQLEGVKEAICGTGDNFEMAHGSTEYNVVDMEAYSLAFVAMQEKIPFLCLKYISDGADDTAAEDWQVQVHHAAVAFKKIINEI